MGISITTEFIPPTLQELQTLFPGYTLSRFIAKGGMGAVYLGKQLSLDRPIAIKILPKEFGDDVNYRHSFEKEAKALARLNHPNLVGIHDFGDVQGMLYIIMEYAPGRSLYHTAHGHSAEEKDAALLVRDMCLGLEHAHEHGIIHRDITPTNVIIDECARPKIIDFGLARPVNDNRTEKIVFGTPGYIAPEVLSTKNPVDQRSDIFSLGVILYELLVGKIPDTPYQLPSSVSDTDPRFDTVIRKSIDPLPQNRYSSAGEMARDLQYLIDHFDDFPVVRSTPMIKDHQKPNIKKSSSTTKEVAPCSSPKPHPLTISAAIVTLGFGTFLALSPEKARSGVPILTTEETNGKDQQTFVSSPNQRINTSKKHSP